MDKTVGVRHEFNLYHYVATTNISYWNDTWRFGPEICQELNKILPAKRQLKSKLPRGTSKFQMIPIELNKIHEVAEYINIA